LATFFYQLGIAVDQATETKEPRLPLMMPEYLKGMDTFVIQFFENFCQRLERPVWVVFDNLQEASVESGLMMVMHHAVERISYPVRIAMISRSEPPPIMARHMANQKLVTIGWPELAFNPTECCEVIRLFSQGNKFDDLAEKLHQQTKGWIAGLILCLQQFPPLTLPDKIMESRSTIFDYFVSEILSTLTPQTREFLLRCSLLDEINSQTAARLTGNEESESILDSLTERNFFVERLKGPGTNYLLHPLFREFLRRYLATSASTKLLQKLYRDAASISSDSGAFHEAVKLYALAKDWEGLSDVILSQASPLIAQGRHRTLQAWLNILPPSVCDKKPMLTFYQGVIRLPTEPLKARKYFSKAFARFVDEEDLAGSVTSWSFLVETFYIARGSVHDLGSWVKEGERLFELSQNRVDPLIGARLACGMLSALTFGEPDPGQWDVWLKRCKKALFDCPDLSQQLKMVNIIVLTSFLQGEMNQVAIIIEQLRSRPQLADFSPLSRVNLHMMECLFFMLTGEVRKCRVNAKKALKVCAKHGMQGFDCLIYSYIVYTDLAVENMRGARINLEKIIARLPPRAYYDHTYFYCLSAWEAYILGDMGRAMALSQEGTRLAAECGWLWAVLVSSAVVVNKVVAFS
jgi:LuxR family transcriptional regulator, maltose regulon positive regulatory protein